MGILRTIAKVKVAQNIVDNSVEKGRQRDAQDNQQAAQANTQPASKSIETKLSELKNLFEKDLITEAEYNEKREALISQM